MSLEEDRRTLNELLSERHHLYDDNDCPAKLSPIDYVRICDKDKLDQREKIHDPKIFQNTYRWLFEEKICCKFSIVFNHQKDRDKWLKWNEKSYKPSHRGPEIIICPFSDKNGFTLNGMRDIVLQEHLKFEKRFGRPDPLEYPGTYWFFEAEWNYDGGMIVVVSYDC